MEKLNGRENVIFETDNRPLMDVLDDNDNRRH